MNRLPNTFSKSVAPGQKPNEFAKLSDVLQKYQHSDEDKYIAFEFQKYGYELAKEMGELKRKSYYIKLAKSTPRRVLESARSFVADASNVKSKGRLFVWKVNKILDQQKENKKK
jgi:hypothetical protein